jgi:hypothetical protein
MTSVVIELLLARHSAIGFVITHAERSTRTSPRGVFAVRVTFSDRSGKSLFVQALMPIVRRGTRESLIPRGATARSGIVCEIVRATSGLFESMRGFKQLVFEPASMHQAPMMRAA